MPIGIPGHLEEKALPRPLDIGIPIGIQEQSIGIPVGMPGNLDEKPFPRPLAIGIPIGRLGNFSKKDSAKEPLPRPLAIGIPIGIQEQP